MKHPILKKYEQHWFTLRDAKYIKNLKDSEIVEIEKVYNELINPTFRVNRFCGSCVAEMVSILYRTTKYDQTGEKFTDATEVQEFIKVLDQAEVDRVEDQIGEEEVVEKVQKKRGRKKKNAGI